MLKFADAEVDSIGSEVKQQGIELRRIADGVSAFTPQDKESAEKGSVTPPFLKASQGL